MLNHEGKSGLLLIEPGDMGRGYAARLIGCL
jgi:hypothetical protein